MSIPLGVGSAWLQYIPQTVFRCRGSYGVGKGALSCLWPRGECALSFSFVNTNESETDLQKHFVKLPIWGTFCIRFESGDDLGERCLLKLLGLLGGSWVASGSPLLL